MRAGRTEAVRELGRLFRLGAVGGLTDAQLLEQFVAGDDEAAAAAFEAIVARHGPMVRRVCRMALRDPHAAEDAFQATFLVLTRKARTLGERELLSNWLYGVAARTARKARSATARRLARGREAASQRPVAIVEPPSEESEGRDELARALHEEIGRLPGSYRAAVVVCYLEGMTQAQAAQQLRLAESTVRGRLARARKLLGHRLARRGLAPSAGLLVLGTATDTAAARLPEATIRSLARAALLFTKAGTASRGAVSATALGIAHGVLSTMWLPSLKTVAATSVAVGLITAWAAAPTRRAAEAQPQVEPPQSTADVEIAAPTPEVLPTPDPASHLPQDSGAGRPRTAKGKVQKSTQSVAVDPDLVKRAPGPIIRAVPVSKDRMILAYLPGWDHGNVDNIGFQNVDGGNRTLIDWPAISPDEATAPDRRFLIALYARQTVSHPPAGPIHAFEVIEDWPERTSWRTQPQYDPEPFGTYKFEPGGGWKLFDITSLVRAQVKPRRESHGLLLRFLSEDRSGAKQNFSGYQFVSREGAGEWANRRPLLLVVKAAWREEPPAK